LILAVREWKTWPFNCSNTTTWFK